MNATGAARMMTEDRRCSMQFLSTSTTDRLNLTATTYMRQPRLRPTSNSDQTPMQQRLQSKRLTAAFISQLIDRQRAELILNACDMPNESITILRVNFTTDRL